MLDGEVLGDADEPKSRAFRIVPRRSASPSVDQIFTVVAPTAASPVPMRTLSSRRPMSSTVGVPCRSVTIVSTTPAPIR